MQAQVCIVIPCYNEALRLPIAEFSAYSEQHEFASFLFVNDGSTDNTQEVLESSFGSRSRFDVLQLEKNVGKANATRMGILKAMDNPTFEIVGFMDADLATPLEEIKRICREFEERPETKASFGIRVQRLGASIQRDLNRHYFGRMFATITTLLLKIKSYDSQCGAKFFRPHFKPVFEVPFHSKWFFDLEIILRYKALYPETFDQEIVEVPVNTWIEIAGSKITFGDFLRTPLELIKLKRIYA